MSTPTPFQSQVGHKMLLTFQWPSGAQCYTCPACGRMVVVQWMGSHTMRRIVLDAGDADRPHIILRNGLASLLNPDQPRPQVPEDSADVSAWMISDIADLLGRLDDPPAAPDEPAPPTDPV